MSDQAKRAAFLHASKNWTGDQAVTEHVAFDAGWTAAMNHVRSGIINREQEALDQVRAELRASRPEPVIPQPTPEWRYR